MNQPQVKVGIMSGKSIGFSFSGDYQVDGVAVKGEHSVSLQDGKVLWNGNLYSEIEFTPVNCESDFFTLFDVTIGVNFHWERK